LKKHVVNDFNRIASVYDALASLVFGKSLIKAQHFFLDMIPAEATVLILGGGSGELLQTLLQQKPRCRVVYVDAAEKMIALARRRVKDSSRVTFLCGTEETPLPVEVVTVIITNFYVDLFTPVSLRRIVTRLQAVLAPNGMWLVTDFVTPAGVWQRLLLATMYRFFKMVSNVEASHISDWPEIMRAAGLSAQVEKMFYSGMIKSVVLQKATFRPHSPEGS
jgi:tRNA (cmo5U34)-methyltransferase